MFLEEKYYFRWWLEKQGYNQLIMWFLAYVSMTHSVYGYASYLETIFTHTHYHMYVFVHVWLYTYINIHLSIL